MGIDQALTWASVREHNATERQEHELNEKGISAGRREAGRERFASNDHNLTH